MGIALSGNMGQGRHIAAESGKYHAIGLFLSYFVRRK